MGETSQRVKALEDNVDNLRQETATERGATQTRFEALRDQVFRVGEGIKTQVTSELLAHMAREEAERKETSVAIQSLELKINKLTEWRSAVQVMIGLAAMAAGAGATVAIQGLLRGP